MFNSKEVAMSPNNTSKDLLHIHLAMLLGAMAILMLFIPEIR